MRIAVDARYWRKDGYDEFSDFTEQVFERLATEHPQHHFIFFFDENGSFLSDHTNVTTIAITPKPVNFFLAKWWYDVKLPIALKRNKADVFIATYGLASSTTSIKQMLIVNNSGFLQKVTPSIIKKSSAVVTLSNFVKEELATRFKLQEQAITVVGSAASPSFKPLTWDEREVIKQQFAEGFEYFIFTIDKYSGANFLNVLKAFSIFKKWQKSNMKLIIICNSSKAFEKELAVLNSYKFRNDVFIKKDLSRADIATVVGASYALVFPTTYKDFAMPVLEAINSNVPVITSNIGSMPEIVADAALYVDPTKPGEIAEQMKRVFKDEQLRNKLIEAGNIRSSLFSWDKTAALLWQVIEQTVCK